MLTNIRQKIEPWFHWHWRSLQDRRQDRERGRGPDTFPFHGQAWFDLGSTAVNSEWELLSPTVMPAVSLRVNTGDGSCVQIHGAVPWLASIYLTLESRWFRPLPDNFTVASLRWFESTFWWTFWRDDDSWDPSVPRWKSGSLHPDDLLLGRQKYQSKVLSVHDVVIPMPEGPYPAVVTLTEDSWTRQRFGWPVRTIRRADSEMKIPIPFQGKGENSWDCGDDACYSLCCPAENLEEAIGAMVTTVLRNRRRYDGDVMAQYPDPKTVKPKVEPSEPAQRPRSTAVLTRRNSMSLLNKITTAINRCSAENGSDTPDFILAQYLMDCLRAFDGAVVARERWYGRDKQVATAGSGPVPVPEAATHE